jgi:hypothetical protein
MANPPFTDAEIQAMLSEQKSSSEPFSSLQSLKAKRAHKEGQIDLDGSTGTKYRIILRQNSLDLFDFSAILGVFPDNSNTLFRLRRYNGRHAHLNSIEKVSLLDFHIHEATERYQSIGLREDSFGVVSNRYSTIHDALLCMISDCNIIFPDLVNQGSLSLFDDVK